MVKRKTRKFHALERDLTSFVNSLPLRPRIFHKHKMARWRRDPAHIFAAGQVKVLGIDPKF